MANNKHLSISDRMIIEKGLNNNSSRKSIADTLGMDKSSICKEIKNHAFFKPFSRSGTPSRGTYDCIHIKVVHSTPSVPIPVLIELLSLVNEKALPAVYVTDVLQNLRVILLKNVMKLKKAQIYGNIAKDV